MTAPHPGSLVVDHPALSVPHWLDGRLTTRPTGGRDPSRLGTGDRNRVAIQLTATASLLAEFDLWPTPGAIRHAVARCGPWGVQAVLGRHPFRLTALTRRLGGGEAASERLRDRLMAEVGRRCGLEVPRAEGDGYFLEPWLRGLLERLGGTVDRTTARNMWALRWTVPPVPEIGEAALWAAPTGDVADRLAAAMWAGLRRAGHRCWVRRVSGEDETAPLPPVGSRGILIVSGVVTPDELEGVFRWAETPGCRAAAIGLFPPGWSPPPLPFDRERLERHLVIGAGSLEQARRLVEGRRGRFHPLSRHDRRALTEEVVRLVSPSPRGARRERAREPLETLLGLLPEGLPEGLVRLHAGLPPAVLDRRAEEIGIVRRDGSWRLPQPAPMTLDPRHAMVAELFARSDPRRLRHLALAGLDADGRLAEWCRRRLRALDGRPVRRLLIDVARGALGDAVEESMADACLLHLDLTTARRSIESLGRDAAEPRRRWLEAADRTLGRGGILDPDTADRAPLPAVAVAVDVLRRRGRSEDARAELERLAGRVDRTVAGWIELEVAAAGSPDRLGDRRWRRRVAAGVPFLSRRLVHLRALALEGRRPSAARRLLTALASSDPTPGERAVLELDLGSVALAAGRPDDADRHGLRALRLLEVAGFEDRTRVVRFNLAVSDIDRLRVDSADRRLAALEAGPHDPYVVAERTRWRLARGDLDRVRTGLVELGGEPLLATDPKLGEAVALLEGSFAMLDGDHETAERALPRGGEEARAWRALLDACRGRRVAADREEDGWGIVRAARRIAGVAAVAADRAGTSPDVRDAFATAVAARVGRGRVEIGSRERSAAAEVLRAAGLSGWAVEVRRDPSAAAVPTAALGRLLEAGGPGRVDREELDQLLRWVGLEGIEAVQAGGGRVVWRFGSGDPGTPRRGASVDLRPLGGEPADPEAWRVLAGVLDLVLLESPTTPLAESGQRDQIVGVAPAIDAMRAELRRLAPTGVAVLVTGETGAGKELVARELHRLSGRSGRFVPVNVAAIPDSLLEAELFGAVRGAFTGADRARRGLAASADGGTLFLDEIGDLSLPMQVKLLRFLESGEVRAVGSDAVAEVDARIVAATHRDLRARIAAGTFREDLYFRVAAGMIEVPPLRERLEDLPRLRALFEREAELRHGLRRCRWSPQAERLLAAHRWPGNVRELRHAVEVAMIRAAGGTVTPADLPVGGAPASRTPAPRRWSEILDGCKRQALLDALERNGGNRSAAARELGISRQALLYHLRQLGLNRPR